MFKFTDGSIADETFFNENIPLNDKKRYIITDYGVRPDGKIYTRELQRLIDKIGENGGGIMVVPAGEFLSGGLFFSGGVDLFIEEGGVLKGSDDISDYPLTITRIEGETCKYFPALINVNGADGFFIYGKGVIDGNGLRSWKDFWLRKEWNENALNKDAQRARLVFISNSKNVFISGVTMRNSQFWNLHLYKCGRVKVTGTSFCSPCSDVRAPSTDAIDIDACSDVFISRCEINVNDDGIALKGGKGPYADTDENNGANERIVISDCKFLNCFGCLTCGSESIHDKNVILCDSQVLKTYNLLWFKMRPDTPQLYEHVLVSGIKGNAYNFINANPWTQYVDMKGRKTVPVSEVKNVTIENCDMKCYEYFNVNAEKPDYVLSDFVFLNLKINAVKYGNEKAEKELVLKRNVKIKIGNGYNVVPDSEFML